MSFFPHEQVLYPPPKPHFGDPLYGLDEATLVSLNNHERYTMMRAGTIPPITRLERVSIDLAAELLAYVHSAAEKAQSAYPASPGLFENPTSCPHPDFLPIYENRFGKPSPNVSDPVHRLCNPKSSPKVRLQTVPLLDPQHHLYFSSSTPVWPARNIPPTTLEWEDIVSGCAVQRNRNTLPFVAPVEFDLVLFDKLRRLKMLRRYLWSLYCAFKSNGFFVAHRFAHVLLVACWELVERQREVGEDVMIEQVREDHVYWHQNAEVLRQWEKREEEREMEGMARNVAAREGEGNGVVGDGAKAGRNERDVDRQHQRQPNISGATKDAQSATAVQSYSRSYHSYLKTRIPDGDGFDTITKALKERR